MNAVAGVCPDKQYPDDWETDGPEAAWWLSLEARYVDPQNHRENRSTGPLGISQLSGSIQIGLPQRSVSTAFGDQLCMRAAFNDLSFIHIPPGRPG